MPRYALQGFLSVALVFTVVPLGGCGKAPPAADRAFQAVLTEFLDSWTKGEPPEKFADPNQPLFATDPDRQAGARLLSFLSVEAKPNPESPDHVLCRVSLSLQDREGKKVEKDVTYNVQVGKKSIIERVPG